MYENLLELYQLFISEPFTGLKPTIIWPAENPGVSPGGISAAPQLFLIKKALGGLDIYKIYYSSLNTSSDMTIYITVP